MVFLLDNDLLKILKSRENGDYLYHSLTKIRDRANKILSQIVHIFPDYTPHTIEHKDQVIQNYRHIIPKSLANSLETYELYFLIVATYLHDIGMVNFPELYGKETSRSIDEQLRKIIRNNHHIKAEEFIVKNYADLGIDDEFQARIIGKIARGHRKEDLHNKQAFKNNQSYLSYSINIPLLSALLRVADELDMTFKRTPIILYDHLPSQDKESDRYWRTHLSIYGLTNNPDNTSEIKCDVWCKDPKIYKLLMDQKQKVNEQIEELPDHLHQYSHCRKDVPIRFIMEVETEGFKPYDFKFTLSEKEIFTLLMGEQIYSRKEESLRELLKNSYDACRIKRDLCIENGIIFSPEIIFEQDATGSKISISDNGIGMDEEVIRRHFTKIGQSFYNSTDFQDKPHSFTPVNELGIGVLSCFMIAKRIEVDTKSENTNALLLEIDGLSDHFIVRESSKKNTGTIITLYLKDELIDKIDLEKEVKTYARHLDIPIKIIRSSLEVTITDTIYSGDANAYNIETKDRKSVFFYPISIDNEFLRGRLLFIGKYDDKLGWIPRTKYLSSYNNPIPRFFLSNEGIFVNNIAILPSCIKSALVSADIDIKNHSIDLDVSRTGVVANEKVVSFIESLESAFVKEAEKLLEVLITKCKENSIPYYSHVNVFLGNYVEWYLSSGKDEIIWNEHDKSLRNKYKIPDTLLELTKRYVTFKCAHNGKLVYYDYHYIRQQNQQIILVTNAPRHISEEFFLYAKDLANDKIYIINEEYTDDYFFRAQSEYILSHLFNNVQSMSFLQLYDIERFRDLRDILPSNYKVIRFKKFESDKLILDESYPTVYLNRQHPFVDLLFKHKKLLNADRRIVTHAFFKNLRITSRNFDKVIDTQKVILSWFVEAGIVKDLRAYILDEEDLPNYW